MEKINLARKGLWILIFVLLTGIGALILDPDYGWHVGVGKYVVEKGIPKSDPFSYTMPSYPFVDHEWLINILFYWGNNFLGIYGMTLVFGILATTALYLGERKIGWELGVILAASILVMRMGIRPQVIDWFLIAVMWKTLTNEKLWQKYRYWWILIFVVWVNLHGGFAIGLGILIFSLVVKQLEVGKLSWKSLGVIVGSLMATFFNPYGWRIWWEVWMQLSDKNLRWVISEWQPFFTQLEPAFWFLGLVWIFLVVKSKSKVWWRILTVGVALLAGLSSLRHAAIFAVLASVDVARMLEEFYLSLNDIVVKQRAEQVYKLFLVIGIGLFLMAVGLQILGFVKGGSRYPEKAISFLKLQNFDGKLFSEYGWGGYLIWKLPDKKVFIDGRMPSWRWPAPDNESDMAMEDYKKVYWEGVYREIFDKYGVKVVLLPIQKDDTKADEFVRKLESKIASWMKNERKIVRKNLVEELLKDGWQKVYQDDVAVVYRSF